MVSSTQKPDYGLIPPRVDTGVSRVRSYSSFPTANPLDSAKAGGNTMGALATAGAMAKQALNQQQRTRYTMGKPPSALGKPEDRQLRAMIDGRSASCLKPRPKAKKLNITSKSSRVMRRKADENGMLRTSQQSQLLGSTSQSSSRHPTPQPFTKKVASGNTNLNLSIRPQPNLGNSNLSGTKLPRKNCTAITPERTLGANRAVNRSASREKTIMFQPATRTLGGTRIMQQPGGGSRSNLQQPRTLSGGVRGMQQPGGARGMQQPGTNILHRPKITNVSASNISVKMSKDGSVLTSDGTTPRFIQSRLYDSTFCDQHSALVDDKKDDENTILASEAGPSDAGQPPPSDAGLSTIVQGDRLWSAEQLQKKRKVNADLFESIIKRNDIYGQLLEKIKDVYDEVLDAKLKGATVRSSCTDKEGDVSSSSSNSCTDETIGEDPRAQALALELSKAEEQNRMLRDQHVETLNRWTLAAQKTKEVKKRWENYLDALQAKANEHKQEPIDLTPIHKTSKTSEVGSSGAGTKTGGSKTGSKTLDNQDTESEKVLDSSGATTLLNSGLGGGAKNGTQNGGDSTCSSAAGIIVKPPNAGHRVVNQTGPPRPPAGAAAKGAPPRVGSRKSIQKINAKNENGVASSDTNPIAINGVTPPRPRKENIGKMSNGGIDVMIIEEDWNCDGQESLREREAPAKYNSQSPDKKKRGCAGKKNANLVRDAEGGFVEDEFFRHRHSSVQDKFNDGEEEDSWRPLSLLGTPIRNDSNLIEDTVTPQLQILAKQLEGKQYLECSEDLMNQGGLPSNLTTISDQSGINQSAMNNSHHLNNTAEARHPESHYNDGNDTSDFASPQKSSKNLQDLSHLSIDKTNMVFYDDPSQEEHIVQQKDEHVRVSQEENFDPHCRRHEGVHHYVAQREADDVIDPDDLHDKRNMEELRALQEDSFSSESSGGPRFARKIFQPPLRRPKSIPMLSLHDMPVPPDSETTSEATQEPDELHQEYHHHKQYEDVSHGQHEAQHHGQNEVHHLEHHGYYQPGSYPVYRSDYSDS